LNVQQRFALIEQGEMKSELSRLFQTAFFKTASYYDHCNKQVSINKLQKSRNSIKKTQVFLHDFDFYSKITDNECVISLIVKGKNE